MTTAGINTSAPSLTSVAAPNDFGPGWYAILASRELPQGKPLALTRFAMPLVAFRTGEGISVMLDRCPHRGVKLSNGCVQADNIVCPFHGLAFNRQGQCERIPVQGPDTAIPKALQATTYKSRELHGFIFIWWGQEPDTLPDIEWFNEELAGCDGPYEHWAECEVGLSRNIENQMDAAHLPFVHKRSIGRLVKSPKMDIDCTVTGQRIRMFLRNGRPGFYLELCLPNIWINRIGTKSWVFLAFVPVTATRTRLYTRYYQGSFNLPVLKQLFGWLMGWSNLWILREDIRIIETHDTKVSPPLDGSEFLLACDLPIIQYRRLRAGWQRHV